MEIYNLSVALFRHITLHVVGVDTPNPTPFCDNASNDMSSPLNNDLFINCSAKFSNILTMLRDKLFSTNVELFIY